MKSIMVKFALWVLKRYGYASFFVPSSVWAIVDRARVLATAEDVRNPASGFGEAKRHAVYARLIKEFPAERKTDLALTIELALTGERS